jgi:hypothetical protein
MTDKRNSVVEQRENILDEEVTVQAEDWTKNPSIKFHIRRRFENSV